jgi:hypothetical protein
MTVTNQNAVIYRGNTAILQVTLTDSDGDPYAPGGGAVVRYRISRNWYDMEEAALVVKGLGTGITILAGVATIDITAEETELEPGLYYHELKITDGPDVSTSMVGTVIVKKSLTMVPTQVQLQALTLSTGAPVL